MKHFKNTALLALAMMCFTSPSHSASFEPLGPDRSLGDVYTDLMTYREMDRLIKDSVPVTIVHFSSHARYFLASSYELHDIFNLNDIDISYTNTYSSDYLIPIKGLSSKYSMAVLRDYNFGGGDIINLFYNRPDNYLNDNSTSFFSSPLNVPATNKATAQVPEPNTLLAMGLVGILLSFRKTVRKFNLK